jgi:hypothetical protein
VASSGTEDSGASSRAGAEDGRAERGAAAAALGRRALRAAAHALRAAEPYAARAAGAAAGLAAGLYGVAAGFLIGAMVDIARLEARERRRIETFLEDPSGEAPREIAEGLAAAAALALRGDWPGTADRETRTILFGRLAAEAAGADARARREAERAADVAYRFGRPDLVGLARRMASSEVPCSGATLLARWAYALAALGGRGLDAGDELRIRAALADCGLGAEEQLAARAAAFPGSKDPWTTLGLSPGASAAEAKRAYRRLSRLFHPDVAEGSADGGARFREVREAYAALAAARPPRA